MPTGLRNRVSLAALCLGMVLSGCGGDSDNGDSEARISGPLPVRGGLLFVLRGDATIEAGRIEVDTGSVEWFTDLPARRAGVAAADQLIENWKAYGFAAVPPNAAVAGTDSDAVVELERPEVTAGGISFDFTAIRGEIAEGVTEQLSLFVDSSEGNVTGRVTNTDSGDGIASYLQFSGPESENVSTNGNGYYSLRNLKKGTYSVTLSASGYSTVVFNDVGVGSATTYDFSLEQSGGGAGGGGGDQGPIPED